MWLKTPGDRRWVPPACLLKLGAEVAAGGPFLDYAMLFCFLSTAPFLTWSEQCLGKFLNLTAVCLFERRDRSLRVKGIELPYFYLSVPFSSWNASLTRERIEDLSVGV